MNLRDQDQPKKLLSLLLERQGSEFWEGQRDRTMRAKRGGAIWGEGEELGLLEAL